MRGADGGPVAGITNRLTFPLSPATSEFLASVYLRPVRGIPRASSAEAGCGSTRVGFAAGVLFVLSASCALAAPMASRELLADGLDIPTNLAHLEDGRIFVLEPHEGHVRVIDDGGLVDEPFLSVQDRMEETRVNEAACSASLSPPISRRPGTFTWSTRTKMALCY